MFGPWSGHVERDILIPCWATQRKEDSRHDKRIFGCPLLE
jgi:hypothetical protein